MIPVTKTYLPPFEEYKKYLDRIWDSHWVTNQGPLLQELEEKLTETLNVSHLAVVNNGTIALQLAFHALDIGGEVLTTPFSFIATTSSLVWEQCEPVFVDIHPDSFNMDPGKIEEAITDRTTAILATHVFGNPCEVEKIQTIADKHDLKVIYDAAHTFGVEYDGDSILEYGDVSTLSFHATKLFHTVEGGALITTQDEWAHQFDWMRNFGHKGPIDYYGVGINGKNSEFHAAIGLCLLPKVREFVKIRKELSEHYDAHLEDTPLKTQKIHPNTTSYNYSYYPVVFEDEQQMLNVKTALGEEQIYPRRYFYPSLNTLDYVSDQECPVAESIASRILCLPLYYDLEKKSVKYIAQKIKNYL